MASRVKLAVMGAGMIGKRHIEHAAATPEVELVGVIDPSPVGKTVAAEVGAPWYASLADMLAARKPDGIIVATPNQLHMEHGLACIAAGIPVLVEKPVTDDVASGTKLVEAAEAAGVPMLVGHHRRHNPLMQKAKEIIEQGRLGQILVVHGAFWLYKADEYFEPEWRRKKGAGPVFLNLIHDVDNLRYLCGEIASVQALESNAVRGNEVEETAAILLRFASGALATITVSDSVVAPWSWELTSGENPVYPHTAESCYHIGGTQASLTIPHLDVWNNHGKRSWWEPIHRERVPVHAEDPLRLQIRQFCAVIRGEAKPLVSGREGLNTLKVIVAVKEAARTGKMVSVE